MKILDIISKCCFALDVFQADDPKDNEMVTFLEVSDTEKILSKGWSYICEKATGQS